ncbi:MAG: hypothetical protein QF668_07485, partial [Arenicellales bacterium]|nr:hypothetical protein [Arenicellales bacterium]
SAKNKFLSLTISQLERYRHECENKIEVSEFASFPIKTFTTVVALVCFSCFLHHPAKNLERI